MTLIADMLAGWQALHEDKLFLAVARVDRHPAICDARRRKRFARLTGRAYLSSPLPRVNVAEHAV